jgi:beta-lysine 5,6-aminomutase alpha subunit
MAHLQLDASAHRQRPRVGAPDRQQGGTRCTLTTTTVERASLRLMGVDGVDDNQVPLPNRVVEHLQRARPAAAGARAGGGRRDGRAGLDGAAGGQAVAAGG